MSSIPLPRKAPAAELSPRRCGVSVILAHFRGEIGALTCEDVTCLRKFSLACAPSVLPVASNSAVEYECLRTNLRLF
jgi:hypothetical protein